MVNMRGFTLIELMVTLAILAMLLLMAAPLAADWVHGARTLQARGTLVQGFENAKALALRNPCADPNATGTPAAAALEAKIEGTTVTLNVLALPQGVSGCALLDARPNPQWTARLPDGVGLTLNGTLLTTGTPLTVNLDNRGLPAASIPFILRRGGHQNDETGTLH
jgi:prepilin-type N-terminal cleavage/methylation domain-containing protein